MERDDKRDRGSKDKRLNWMWKQSGGEIHRQGAAGREKKQEGRGREWMRGKQEQGSGEIRMSASG